jgi:DNA-binding NarL/FixJ family response regulator
MAARISGDAEQSARLAASAVVRGREHGDATAVSTGSQLLLSLPEELRPRLDPPLPGLVELLEQCERADQPYTAMTVLGVLARQSLLGGDPAAAARWIWRLLMIAANRQRSEPLATVGGAAMLLSVAVALGDREDAARLRESLRPFELFVPYCVGPPDAFADYQRDVASLEASVPPERREELAAEGADLGLEQINRRAQEMARRLSGHRPPHPETAPASTLALTPREHDVLAALASGRTNREIATQLGMSAKTVMHHSVAIYRKLGVQGRSAATAWAYQHQYGVAAER